MSLLRSVPNFALGTYVRFFFSNSIKWVPHLSNGQVHNYLGMYTLISNTAYYIPTQQLLSLCTLTLGASELSTLKQGNICK